MTTSPTITQQPEDNDAVNKKRRSFLRKLAVGSAAVAGCSVLPEKWSTPLVNFATLPAHATTSGDILALIEEIEDAVGIENELIEETDTPEPTTTAKPDESTAAQVTSEPVVSESIETTPTQETVTAAEEVVEDNGLRGYSNSLTIKNVGDKMSCDSIWQDKFVFSRLGPEYGPSFLLVWSDGRELNVPDSASMAMIADQNDYRKYQPGGVYSHNNPDIPTMEVYAARGTHPDSVTLYY